MIVLGISITHNGTLTILKNGQNIYSIAEERLNRIKAYIGFPFLALEHVVKNKIINPKEINKVAVSSSIFLKEWAFTFAFQLTENKKYYDLQNEKKPRDFFIDDKDYLMIKSDEECRRYVDSKIKRILKKYHILAPIEYIEHHLAHAASAYYTSGFNDALAITMDGEGDLLSATINICNDGKIERISETSNTNSAGYLYSEVTRACGFKVSRHEGKITGLAAYGDYTKKEKCFSKLVKVKDGKLFYINPVERKLYNKVINKILNLIGLQKLMGAAELIKRCGYQTNEDLSASIQNLLEIKIIEIVTYWVKKTGLSSVVLAGGVFANVKFNQQISKIRGLENLYIFPDMGDGGNAYGSAAVCYFSNKKFDPEKSKTVNTYYGPQYKKQYIENLLKTYSKDLEFHYSKNVEKETAKFLANNKIVGWFQGRMEYGPRALGNRSIIASPTDASINQWLNEKMKRNEFMPFAPSCIYEYSDELFEIPKESMKFPAQFMTITFKMKKKWALRAPAVSHIDQTARPQLVTKESNPKYYKLLTEYFKLTGLPLFINTSFNVHEEPIVCKPEEGLKSLLNGVIDYFVCGNYICARKNFYP